MMQDIPHTQSLIHFFHVSAEMSLPSLSFVSLCFYALDVSVVGHDILTASVGVSI